MFKLTPNKVYGYALPDREKIGRGNTSLVYLTDDPKVLEVFTIEHLKMEWWLRGLNIVEDYFEVAEARYCGYSYNFITQKSTWTSVQLPVYRCLVQRLDMPGKAERRVIKAATAAVWGKRPNFDYRRGQWQHQEWWSALTYLDEKFPAVAEAAEFITNYDSDRVYPDFGPGDWAMLDGKLVCIDPYHHKDVSEATSMRATPVRR
jgi:hypothetical protein